MTLIIRKSRTVESTELNIIPGILTKNIDKSVNCRETEWSSYNKSSRGIQSPVVLLSCGSGQYQQSLCGFWKVNAGTGVFLTVDDYIADFLAN